MSKRKNILSQAEKFAEYLLYEATGGSMGRERRAPPDKVLHEVELEFTEKRAFLDTLIKLVGVKNKVDPEDITDGIEKFRDALNDDGDSGRKTNGRGASVSETETHSIPAANEPPPLQ